MIHTLLLDLFIGLQFILLNVALPDRFTYSFFNRLTLIGKILVVGAFNLAAVGLLYLMGELWLSFLILTIESGIIGFVGVCIIFVVYSTETWFEFIM